MKTRPTPPPPRSWPSKGRNLFLLLLTFGLGGCGAQFTHVKPGQSAWLSLASVPPIVASSAEAPGLLTQASPAQRRGTGPDIHVEPPLPLANLDPLQPASVDVFGGTDSNPPKAKSGLAEREQQLREQPGTSEEWRKLVVRYEQAGDNAGAVRAFKEAKRAGTRDTDAHVHTGASLGLR